MNLFSFRWIAELLDEACMSLSCYTLNKVCVVRQHPPPPRHAIFAGQQVRHWWRTRLTLGTKLSFFCETPSVRAVDWAKQHLTFSWEKAAAVIIHQVRLRGFVLHHPGRNKSERLSAILVRWLHLTRTISGRPSQSNSWQMMTMRWEVGTRNLAWFLWKCLLWWNGQDAGVKLQKCRDLFSCWSQCLGI